ncbi:MAG: hypothetical protein OXG35_01140 [Acidobacteria bacterium]|nr:hypothetical protein [Acidobacteriota bacterium]
MDYATEDETATAGADYTAASGTLTFASGETEKTVSVSTLPDLIDERQEVFRLNLSNASGAGIRDGRAAGRIKDAKPASGFTVAQATADGYTLSGARGPEHHGGRLVRVDGVNNHRELTIMTSWS